MDASGVVRVWQVESMELYKAAQTWKQMVGVDQKALSVIYETDKVCNYKHVKHLHLWLTSIYCY